MNIMAGNKFYVVWKGFATGVFESWDEAQIQVSGYPDAQYRAFKSMEEAVEAFRQGYDQDGLIQEVKKQVAQLNKEGHKIVWDPEKAKNTPTPSHLNTSTPSHLNTSTPQRPYITRSIAAILVQENIEGSLSKQDRSCFISVLSRVQPTISWSFLPSCMAWDSLRSRISIFLYIVTA